MGELVVSKQTNEVLKKHFLLFTRICNRFHDSICRLNLYVYFVTIYVYFYIYIMFIYMYFVSPEIAHALHLCGLIIRIRIQYNTDTDIITETEAL